jgi:hypothetical protein
MASPSPSFNASQVSPQDAIVTLRSLRRRFAEAFDEAEGAGLSGSSPLEHAAATATALQAIGSALERVMVADDPEITLPPVDLAGTGGAVRSDRNRAGVLARLDDVARSVADTMAKIHGEDWSRTGRTPAGEESALDIARLGVRIGIEHLRAAEQAIRAARG